jgi:predicted ATP-grasp superfamily ATP-dependent carboligase
MSAGATRLLGVSRQIIGDPWCHAGMFAWCGAVALRPGRNSPDVDRLVAPLVELGNVLAERFRPVGLIGVDLIVDAAGRVTVIEVNPRPTASMELFERSGAGSIAGSHLAACGFPSPSDIPLEQPRSWPTSTWAKAVLFAAQPTPVSQPLIDALSRETNPWTQADGGWPALADIPRPGQIIAAGAPAVTIFAVAPTAEDALATLRDRVAHIDALLTATP